MTEFELARALFRKEPNEGETKSAHVTTQIHGYATSASVDGSVTVVLDSNAGGEDAEMEVPTLGGITEGAEVMVTLVDGTPVDCSQVGSIDTTAATANSAQAVANATAQHVWTDDSGLHVTEVEQDEWNDSTSEGYHSGMNVLLNALGQLFRNGLNNMLALISGTDPAIEIYDGEGNEEANVVAGFKKDEITLCGGAGRIVAGNYGAISIIGTQPRLIGKTADDASAAMFYVGTSNGTNYAGITAWSDTNTSAVNIQLYPVIDGLYSVPTISIQADGSSGDFAVTDLINAIPVTLYNNEDASASASATLSETAANFRRMTILYKDTDNTRGSVEVWSPNGKRVALALTWINGTATQSMYQRVRWVTISGTSISTAKNSSDAKYRTGQIQLGAAGSVDNSDYISITHVIGYR